MGCTIEALASLWGTTDFANLTLARIMAGPEGHMPGGLLYCFFHYGVVTEIFPQFVNWLAGGNEINPVIGAAGISAVPMAARVAQAIGQEEDPGNFLLMHAMGPNVAGTFLALLH